MARRTILVGDIHGCPGEFDELMARVGYRAGRDRLVLVGDLVARGPDSRGVVERAEHYGADAVRGNHDERVLQWWRVARRKGPEAADREVKLSERHRVVVEALDDRHFERLDALPLVLRLPEHGLAVVHAAVDPRRQPEECDPEVLLVGRSIDERGEVVRQLLPTPWARRWRGPTHVVFGHDARRNLQLEPFATGLDTGCVYGRALTAMVLDEAQAVPSDVEARRALLVSVPARAVYCPTGTGDGPE